MSHMDKHVKIPILPAHVRVSNMVDFFLMKWTWVTIVIYYLGLKKVQGQNGAYVQNSRAGHLRTLSRNYDEKGLR